MGKDYYSILGIDKGSSSDEIKKAYRKLSKKYHPDISKEDNAEEKFKEINEAYSVLSDSEKRSNYDNYGTSDGRPSEGHSGRGGFGDFFDQFTGNFSFEDIFNRGGGRQRRRGGNDIKIRVGLSLDEVEIGGEKSIKYKRKVSCTSCSGKGGSDERQCVACNGRGARVKVQTGPFGRMEQRTTCENCGGIGKIVINQCNDCRGQGNIEHDEELTFDISLGVSSGISYKYSSKGNENKWGKGDLIIEFIVVDHPDFRRQDMNLIYDLHLPFTYLVLGGNLKIQGLNGKTLDVVIPENTQPGSVLRLRRQGLPLMDNPYVKGDILLNVQFEFPEVLSDEEKDIVKELNNKPNFIYKSKK